MADAVPLTVIVLLSVPPAFIVIVPVGVPVAELFSLA